MRGNRPRLRHLLLGCHVSCACNCSAAASTRECTQRQRQWRSRPLLAPKNSLRYSWHFLLGTLTIAESPSGYFTQLRHTSAIVHRGVSPQPLQALTGLAPLLLLEPHTSYLTHALQPRAFQLPGPFVACTRDADLCSGTFAAPRGRRFGFTFSHELHTVYIATDGVAACWACGRHAFARRGRRHAGLQGDLI
jgi:hypothetical protein